MDILKAIANFVFPASRNPNNTAWVSVQCSRCGETIRCRVNMNNDLSIQYGEHENDVTYYCRKLVIGEQRCYQKIEVELTFDKNRKLIEKKVVGGKFIELSYGS